MYAIEFQTKVRNGNIEIPEEYMDRFRGLVRVIILVEDKFATADMIDHLLTNPLQVENFKPFTREELYERP